MTRIVELFGIGSAVQPSPNWAQVVDNCRCPYLHKRCLKNRKSAPEILIGTCTVANGRNRTPLVICPHRLLERQQIFTDAIHLLTLHEPGNELHLLSEVTIPGGSVDYFLLSVSHSGKVRDFVGIELQTLDTTGTVWPERQRFLKSVGVPVSQADVDCRDTFGMNWKMTAKTILMQLHHKIETFENVGKHLVLAMQDPLLEYMEQEFVFEHISKVPRIGDAMHFHAYSLAEKSDRGYKLHLTSRHSTDAAGVASALGRKISARVELLEILEILQAQVSPSTLLSADQFMDFTPATKPS